MKDLMELLKKKKKGEPLPENYKKAKMGVLKEIGDMASSDMGEGIKGLKKVTVASPDKEGLEKGLGLAEKMISKSEDGDEAACGMCGKEPCACEEESSESSAEAGIEAQINQESLSDSEIDQLVKLLQSKKKGS